MLFNISLLVVLAGSIINAASASSALGTNAERMARGLPPMAPARMRRGSASFKVSPQGRPSPSPSHSSSPSPTPSQPHRLPPNCYNGKVKVQYNKGHSTVFLKNGGISSVNSSEVPLEVNVCKAGSHTGFYDIVATNANFSSPYYLGASSGNTTESLTDDKESSLKFVNVAQTSPSVPPTLVNDSYVESAIWSLSSRTKELSAKWTNPDQSNSPVTILFDNSTNELSFVGGGSQWWNVSGSALEAVHLYLA